MGLDSVELLLEFEDSFEVSLSDEEAEKAVTPGILADIIYEKKKNTGVITREEILSRICRITSEQQGIPESDIKESSRFFADLGID